MDSVAPTSSPDSPEEEKLPEDSTSQKTSNIPKKSSKKGFVIGVAILIVILGIGAFIFLTNKSKQNIQEVSKEPTFTGEIVIGYNADQTVSSTAAFGVSGVHGLEIAIDEINAKGGVLGKKLKAVILDDKGDKEISKKNIEQLIFQDKAVAIIGPANSANALYWLDIPQNNEVTIISNIATATEMTTKFKDRPKNYIFRVSSLDSEQTRLLVAWMVNKTNNGKIAIIHEATPYGTKGAKDASEVLARWGKTPVLVKSFEKTASVEDLVKIVKSAKASGADGIYTYGYADTTANLLKALGKVEGYEPVVSGAAANRIIEIWEKAGPLATNLYFPAGVTADANEYAKELNKKVLEKFGTTPIFSTVAQTYDIVQLLSSAIKKAGTTDRKAVRDAYENVENVQGVVKFYTKPYSKESHEALSINELSIAHWVDGKLVKIDESLLDLEIR